MNALLFMNLMSLYSYSPCILLGVYLWGGVKTGVCGFKSRCATVNVPAEDRGLGHIPPVM
jgi:hypothetical protein